MYQGSALNKIPLVLGCSADVQIAAHGEVTGLPQHLCGIEKILAREITECDNGYRVTLDNGEVFTVAIRGERTMYASGSSINTLRVLHALGQGCRYWEKYRVWVVMPVADCMHGRYLQQAVRDMGAEPIVVPADATSMALSLQTSSGRIIIGRKATYAILPEAIPDLLPKIRFSMALLTGFRPEDFTLVRALREWSTAAVCMPHRQSLGRDDRDALCAILKRSLMVQLNERETRLAFSDYQPTCGWALSAVSSLDAERLIVTRSHDGATLFLSNGSVIKSSVSEPKPLDVTGAGDAHFAAFAYFRFLQHCYWTLDNLQALEMAGFVAASSVRHLGPCYGIPTAQEVPFVAPFWESEPSAASSV